jgi:hypothetical protein
VMHGLELGPRRADKEKAGFQCTSENEAIC